MKASSKKLLIWAIWFFILLIISISYALQAVQDTRPLIEKLPQGLLVCAIPYLFFTLFYVFAVITKQLIKIPYLLLTDIISIVLIANNLGYFYEGPQVAFNSLLAASVIIIIKVIILVLKKHPQK